MFELKSNILLLSIVISRCPEGPGQEISKRPRLSVRLSTHPSVHPSVKQTSFIKHAIIVELVTDQLILVWVVVGTRWYKPSFFFLGDLEVLHSVTKSLVLID